MKLVTIHTDGGCDGNPGPGGWAAILEHAGRRKELSGGVTATTNNRMELMAAIAGLAALREPCAVTLWTDSSYLREGMTRWLPSWKRRGWRTTTKQPVKNLDLWKRLEALTDQHHVTWKWLKGHAGDAGNEHCDVLATAEITRLKHEYSSSQLREFRREFESDRNRADETPGADETCLPLKV